MDEDVKGPVILINKFSVKPEEFDQFLKGWKMEAGKFEGNQAISRLNYTEASEKAAPSLTMQFGNL